MPYTAAQLNQYVTTVNQGVAPDAATTTLLAALATQNAAGTLTDAQTLNQALRFQQTQSTTDVALATYEFFTGSVPSAAGLAFLVNNPTANANGLSSVYYQTFNQENRYYNFAINLGVNTASASSAQFAATYGGLTFAQTVQSAYEKIVGSSNAAAIADIVGRQAFFAQVAKERAGTFNQDLATKAIVVGYILNEAVKADLGVYAQAIDAFNVSLSGAVPFTTVPFGTDIVTGSAGNVVVNLTNGTDIVTANVFNAGQVYTPGGDDRINSLQDEDVLTGAGTNPTLNLTFGTPNDNGTNLITPTLRGINTVNVAFTASASSSETLDLQDATGVTAVNITRITDTNGVVTVKNLAAEPATISIANTNSPAATVVISTTDAAMSGTADATQITLSNATIKALTNETVGQISGATATGSAGVESISLISSGSANSVGSLNARGLKALTISGNQNLNLGDNTINVINGTAQALGQAEATHFAPAFNREIGTLANVNASALTGNLSISFGAEVTGNSVNSSGGPVNFTFLGGSGNDTVRLLGSIDPVGDNLDGGTGTNTLVVGGNVTLVGSGVPATTSTLKNFQALEVRTGADLGAGADTTTIDASLVGGLTAITVRNEGQDQNLAGQWVSTAEAATVNLTKLSAAQAAAITVLHGTTGNNGLGGTVINATLAADGGADLVGVTLGTNLNTDQRFNLVVNAGNATTNKVESVTLNDLDNESNTVQLSNAAFHTGTVTLTGGTAGQFLNLDATANIFRLDESGSPLAAGPPADLPGVVDPLNGAAERFVASKIDATASLDDIIIRVSQGATGGVGAQTILMGAGNDTVIFDAISTVAAPQQTAGLSISDTVNGGTGVNTLVIDGDVAALPGISQHINIGASEWTNVKNFQVLALVGDRGLTNASAFGELASDAGGNAYNLSLTNDFILANSVVSGGISRIVIVNDNDSLNDALGTVNTAGTGQESGVTIDARTLDATVSFAYNGEEGSTRTNDRFILADANINGTAVIDGGAFFAYPAGVSVASGLGNNDVLEARNAAVVTLGDLAGVKNVGTLEFANDTAVNQSATLQLNSATVDALVNSYHTAGTTVTATDPNPIERLTIHAVDNVTVGAATTQLNLDASAVSGAFGLDVLLGRGLNNITASSGADIITELGNYAVGTYAGVRDGGTVNAAQDTRLNIDALANNVAGARAVTDTINGGAGIDTLQSYGSINYAGATITGIEAFVFNSNVTITDKQYADAVAAANASGNTSGAVFTFKGAGPHTLTIVDTADTSAIDLSRVDGGSDSSALTINTAGLVGNAVTGAAKFPGDLTAPVAPTALGLTLATDTGVAGDNVTKIAQPTVTGTAEANSTVFLYEGATKIGTGVTNSAGTFTVSPTVALTDGLHNLTVAAQDANLNLGVKSAVYGLTIDTTAPVAGTAVLSAGSDTGVSNSDGITKLTSLDFAISGSEAGSKAVLFNDVNANGTVDAGEQLGTTQTVSGGGTASFTGVALTAGTYANLKVAQTDVGGNVTNSAIASVTVDTTAPSSPVGSPSILTDVADNGTTTYGSLSHLAVNWTENLGTVDTSKIHVFDTTAATEVTAGNFTASIVGGHIDIAFTGGIVDTHSYSLSFDAGAATDLAGNLTPLLGVGAVNFLANT